MKSLLCFFLSAFFCIISSNSFAQSFTDNEIGRFSLCPTIETSVSLPAGAYELLMNKLKQCIISNGVANNPLNRRFIITANIVELSTNVTATAPVYYTTKLSPTLYIGDCTTGELYASCSLPNVTGVGRSRDLAYMKAIESFPVNGDRVVSFIESAKAKIKSFYASNGPAIIQEAQTLCAKGDFDEALTLLLSVPDIDRNTYIQCQDIAKDVYAKKVDAEGLYYLKEAERAWHQGRDYNAANQAFHYISMINGSSTAISKVDSLIREINERLKQLDKYEYEREQKEWEMSVQQYRDNVELTKQKMAYDNERRKLIIQSIGNICQSLAGRPLTINRNYYSNWWW